jgi:hypothetical protein
MEAEDGQGEDEEEPTQRVEAAIRGGDAEPLPDFCRQVGGRNGRQSRTPSTHPEHERNRQQQNHQRQPRYINQTQQRGLLLRNNFKKHNV